MNLHLPWQKSDMKWLIDGHASAGNPFHGFVEVNDHTGDAEEMACLIVRALKYYQASCKTAPLWELLDKDGAVVGYYEERPEPGGALLTEKAFLPNGERPGQDEPAPGVAKARMCYNVPDWWEAP